MKKSNRPQTKVKKPEPKEYNSNDWIIWAAWADRITFEEIYEKTNKKESDVIKIGTEIFELIIDTALGKPSKSEINEYGDDEFNPWVIGATV